MGSLPMCRLASSLMPGRFIRSGGGGHFDMAGAQIKNTTLTYACELLKGAIDDYLDHDLADEK